MLIKVNCRADDGARMPTANAQGREPPRTPKAAEHTERDERERIGRGSKPEFTPASRDKNRGRVECSEIRYHREMCRDCSVAPVVRPAPGAITVNR